MYDSKIDITKVINHDINNVKRSLELKIENPLA